MTEKWNKSGIFMIEAREAKEAIQEYDR